MSFEILDQARAMMSRIVAESETRIIARLELLEQRGAVAIGRIGPQPVNGNSFDAEDDDSDFEEAQEQAETAKAEFEEAQERAIAAQQQLETARAARYARLNRR